MFSNKALIPKFVLETTKFHKCEQKINKEGRVSLFQIIALQM